MRSVTRTQDDTPCEKAKKPATVEIDEADAEVLVCLSEEALEALFLIEAGQAGLPQLQIVERALIHREKSTAIKVHQFMWGTDAISDSSYKEFRRVRSTRLKFTTARQKLERWQSF